MRTVEYNKTCPTCGGNMLKPSEYPLSNGMIDTAVYGTHYACSNFFEEDEERNPVCTNVRYVKRFGDKKGLCIERMEHVQYVRVD